MPDETSPEQTDFPITLGGKPYILAFPLPSIWAYEKLTGVDWTNGTNKRTQEERVAAEMQKSGREREKDVGDLLWAGLVAHHADIKREEVESIILSLTYRQLGNVTKRVMEAFTSSMPQSDNSKEEGSAPLAESRPN